MVAARVGRVAHLDAVLGAHAGGRRQRPVPDGEAVGQARHEQVRVAAAQLDGAEEAVLRHAKEILKVRLLCRDIPEPASGACQRRTLAGTS